MPFTPKFVDLVKNSTSVQGTGAVTLGAALAGFTGFASACAPGDQFYYCIQGVDKPAEREVGRGTFQADGTISRDAALGGPLKNFSSGTKTIALVAAAEWFAKLDAVASAPAPTSSGGAPTPLFSAAAGSIIAAPVVAISTAGYSANGIGEARYVQDAAVDAAYVSANPRTSFRAADGRGFRLCTEQRLTVEMFGAVPNDSGSAAKAANDAAFKAACEFRPTAGSNYGAEVRAGAASYSLGVTLEPEGAFRLIGQGSGHYGGGIAGVSQTRLIWPTDTCCIRVRAGGTDGTGLGAGKIAARDSVIAGLSIEQATMGGNLAAHGVHMRGNATVRDCLFINIAGDGVNVTADSSYTNPATAGFADEWRVIECFIICGGNGVYSEGSEANAGYTQGVMFHQCGGCAIFDQSKFANAHYSPQITGYGNGNPAGVWAGGRAYQLITPDLTLGGTTTPGTNNQIWYDLGALAAADANFPAWVSGTAYRPRLPFLITSGSPIVGMYQESGRNAGHSNGVVVGGTGGGDSYTNVLGTDGYGGLVNQRGMGRFRSHGGQGAAWPAWTSLGDGEEVFIGRLDDDVGPNGRSKILWYRSDPGGDKGDGDTFEVTWAGNRDIVWNLYGRRMMTMSGRQTAISYGRPTVQPGYVGFSDFGLINPGDGNQARIIGIRDAMPGSGDHARGEFLFNVNPSATGILGWSCTAGGTPGTWTAVPVTGFTGSFAGDSLFGGNMEIDGALSVMQPGNYGLRAAAGGGVLYLDNQKPSAGFGYDIYYRTARSHILQCATTGDLSASVQDVATVNTAGLTVVGKISASGTIDAGGTIKQAGNAVWHAGNLTQFGSGAAGFVPASGGGTANFLRADGTWAAPPSGSGTVTSVSVASANGINGTVATATTTPAITLTLGAITPVSVAATGTVTGSNLSGTNSGDQTITLAGDVTGSGTSSFAATIGANKVTFAKLVAATQAAFVGATGAGNFGELTPAAATAQLSAMVGSNGTVAGTKGLVPAPAAADNLKLLRGDGTWASAITPASVAATGGITSSGGGVGYATGAGGIVTQLTSRTTGVTLSKLSGAITLFSTTTTAGQTTTLTVTNTLVAASDTVVVSQKSGTGLYVCAVTAVASGSFNLSIYTPAAVGTAEAPVLNFAVVKAVAA